MYRYFGAHWACKCALMVSLLWASAPHGHAAAWLGAQNPRATRWAQAGVARIGSQTLLYAEANGPSGYEIRFRPWATGVPVRVSLQHRGNWWRAGARGLWTRWVHLKHEINCSVLELFNGAHGLAVIARRRIVG